MAKRRIGIFGMSQEAMLATPGHLDPRTVLISRGQEIIANNLWVARGIVATLQAAPDVEIVPLMTVRCRASAAFHRDFFDACVAEITALIRQNGPFDGLVAANHGAMEVEGLEVSGDTALMEAVRQAVGPDVPITMALDMHGHLTPGLLRDAQGFAIFRTAPHRPAPGRRQHRRPRRRPAAANPARGPPPRQLRRAHPAAAARRNGDDGP